MSRLIIFAPYCGGNHLANLIGASQNLSNCLDTTHLLDAYKNNSKHIKSHFNDLFIHENLNFKKDGIYIGHLDQVYQSCEKFPEIEKQFTEVLVIEIDPKIGNTILRGRQISFLEQTLYCQRALSKLFKFKNYTSVTVKDLFSPFDVLNGILRNTKFAISKECKPMHEIWLDKVSNQ